MHTTDIIAAHYVSIHMLNEDYVTAMNMVKLTKYTRTPVVTDAKHGKVQVMFRNYWWEVSLVNG